VRTRPSIEPRSIFIKSPDYARPAPILCTCKCLRAPAERGRESLFVPASARASVLVCRCVPVCAGVRAFGSGACVRARPRRGGGAERGATGAVGACFSSSRMERERSAPGVGSGEGSDERTDGRSVGRSVDPLVPHSLGALHPKSLLSRVPPPE
jgi:hypothetical protein